MMPWGGGGFGRGNVRNGHDRPTTNHTPGSPSRGACRSTGRETPNTHTDEIEKRRPYLPPVVDINPSIINHGSRAQGTHQIGIPHPHGIPHADLPHQQTVHPSKRKLHKLYALRSKVLGERRINACHELRHALDAALDTRLCSDVVVLDPVQQTREAPKRIGLDCDEYRGGEDRGVDFFGISICEFCLVVMNCWLVTGRTTYRHMQTGTLRRTVWRGRLSLARIHWQDAVSPRRTVYAPDTVKRRGHEGNIGQ